MADRCACESCRVLRALGEARRAAQVASHAFEPQTYAHDAAWNAAYDAWDAAVAASRVAALLVEQTADALVAERARERPDAAGLYHGRRDVELPGARSARSVRVPELAAELAQRLGFTPHGRPRVVGESVRDVIATLDAVRLTPDDERRMIADTEAMRAARATCVMCHGRGTVRVSRGIEDREPCPACRGGRA